MWGDSTDVPDFEIDDVNFAPSEDGERLELPGDRRGTLLDLVPGRNYTIYLTVFADGSVYDEDSVSIRTSEYKKAIDVLVLRHDILQGCFNLSARSLF